MGNRKCDQSFNTQGKVLYSQTLQSLIVAGAMTDSHEGMGAIGELDLIEASVGLCPTMWM